MSLGVRLSGFTEDLRLFLGDLDDIILFLGEFGVLFFDKFGSLTSVLTDEVYILGLALDGESKTIVGFFEFVGDL